ncbi:MAG TPA: tetratricopeptide repeat protein [Kofleriaceae bacterium]
MRIVVVVAVAVVATTANADVGALGEAALRSHAGDHVGAIRIYEDAYRSDPDPALLAILGNEYTSAGQLRDALQRFCGYLAVAPNGDDVVTVLAQLELVRAELAIDGDACSALAPPHTVPPVTFIHASRNRQLAIGAAAAGVAGIAAGLYFGHQASATADQISLHDPTQPWPSNVAEIERRGQRFELERDVFYGLGVSALVAAGILYVTGREERVSVTPIMSHGGGGFALGHRF